MFSLLSIAYLPPISQFVLLEQLDKTYFESCENYTKQTYRNRCNILSANGVIPLSIPVEKVGEKQQIKDVRIAEHDNWQQQHWRAITSAYRSSPFFEYYEDDFRPFYEKKWTFLWDYNWKLIELILNLLDIEANYDFTTDFVKENPKYFDARFSIQPKNKKKIVDIAPYYQVFEQKFGFQSDLSIIDLLFNMGNESIFVLRNSNLASYH